MILVINEKVENSVISSGQIKKINFTLLVDKESSSNSKGESESEKPSSNSKSSETTVKVEVEKKFVPATNDDVRQKCREMIKNSLKSSEEEDCKGTRVPQNECFCLVLRSCIVQKLNVIAYPFVIFRCRENSSFHWTLYP